MVPLKFSLSNLKANIVRVHGLATLHIWTLLKILLLSSKVCKRWSFSPFFSHFFPSFTSLSTLSHFSFFLLSSHFLNCSLASSSSRLSRFYFFYFVVIFFQLFSPLLKLPCFSFFMLLSSFLTFSFSSSLWKSSHTWISFLFFSYFPNCCSFSLLSMLVRFSFFSFEILS